MQQQQQQQLFLQQQYAAQQAQQQQQAGPQAMEMDGPVAPDYPCALRCIKLW